MTKYVKLNDARTEWASALFQVKPANVRRHPDSKLPEFNWFPVKEYTDTLPDEEIYYHAVDTWEVKDGVVHLDYKPTLIKLHRRREILSDRVTAIRDRRLQAGLSFMGFPFDTKESTYKLILGITMKAIVDPQYTTYWITEDNRRVKLGAKQIMAFGDAYEQFQNQHHMRARDLKDTIESSNQPHVIDLEEDWPDTDYYPNMKPLKVVG